jgi:hypothetical protein
VRLSSPGLRPFLARQESLTAAILRCAAARAGAASIAFGFQIAIEAAVVAGSKTARRSDMANIGSFKKSGQELQGEIVTLSLQTKGVRIVPEADRTSDNAPSHRVYWVVPIMRSGALCGAVLSEFRFSAGLGIAALHIIPREEPRRLGGRAC